MIKIKRKRKNPNDYITLLKKLLGKEVTVRINYPSELGYFSITGKLEYYNDGTYGVEHSDKNKTLAGINFTPNMILDISNNLLNIKIKNHDHLSKYHNEFGEAGILAAKNSINHEIKIIISSNLPHGVISIIGKLKHNKQNNFYYIQSSDFLIQLRFYEIAIVGGNECELLISLDEIL